MKKLFLLAGALAFASTAILAQRTEVKELTATGFKIPSYGDVTSDVRVAIVDDIQYPSDAPYRTELTMGSLYKKNDENRFVPYYDIYITEGTYYFKMQIRIDDDALNTYCFPSQISQMSLKVDGNKWTLSELHFSATVEWVWGASPEFTIVNGNVQLTFNDDSSFDYGACYVGVAVQEKNLKTAVVGGTGSYTFSKVTNNCQWLTVSTDGKMSGTPTQQTSSYVYETIQVSDGNDTKTIQIKISPVYPKPADRTKLEVAEFTGFVVPALDASTAITLNATSGTVYSLGAKQWYKKNGESWNNYSGSTFAEGIYRCQVQLYVIGDNGHYYMIDAETKMKVNGAEWAACGNPEIGDVYSFRTYNSPEYVVTKPTSVDAPVADGLRVVPGGVEYGGEYCIYTLTGTNVTAQNGNLSRGIYVVRTANGAVKVSVAK